MKTTDADKKLIALEEKYKALEAAADANGDRQYIAGLQQGYRYGIDENHDDLNKAIAGRRNELAALLDSEPSAHTCNASCQRPACVLRRRVEELEGRLKAYELHYGVMSGAAIQHILNSGHGNNLTEKEWIEAKAEQEGDERA